MAVIKSFSEMLEKAKLMAPVVPALVCAEHEQSIVSLTQAIDLGLVKSPILIGNKKKIELLCKKHNLTEYEVRNCKNSEEAANAAVDVIKSNKAQIIMKGLVDTKTYIKAIINGLKVARVLSNMTLFELDTYHKLLGITDNGICIQPDYDDKCAIISNTKRLWSSLGIARPKAAVIAAIEKVNEKMRATTDAAMLTKKGIPGFSVYGPLGYDAAISKEAAKVKGINSAVAGDPDLILAPDLQSANILGKCLKFNGLGKSGGLIFGAFCPVILNSRSDDAERRLNSIIMARLISTY